MSSHRGMGPEARARAGVSDSLSRLSAGVDALEDLFADLEQLSMEGSRNHLLGINECGSSGG